MRATKERYAGLGDACCFSASYCPEGYYAVGLLRIPFEIVSLQLLLLLMAHNFSSPVHYDGQTVLAVFLPRVRQNGLHYEVNINGFPRFYLHWSPLGRYDITDPRLPVPDNLIIALGDILDAVKK